MWQDLRNGFRQARWVIFFAPTLLFLVGIVFLVSTVFLGNRVVSPYGTPPALLVILLALATAASLLVAAHFDGREGWLGRGLHQALDWMRRHYPAEKVSQEQPTRRPWHEILPPHEVLSSEFASALTLLSSDLERLRGFQAEWREDLNRLQSIHEALEVEADNWRRRMEAQVREQELLRQSSLEQIATLRSHSESLQAELQELRSLRDMLQAEIKRLHARDSAEIGHQSIGYPAPSVSYEAPTPILSSWEKFLSARSQAVPAFKAWSFFAPERFWSWTREPTGHVFVVNLDPSGLFLAPRYHEELSRFMGETILFYDCRRRYGSLLAGTNYFRSASLGALTTQDALLLEWLLRLDRPTRMRLRDALWKAAGEEPSTELDYLLEQLRR
jgi:hypothetical protein